MVHAWCTHGCSRQLQLLEGEFVSFGSDKKEKLGLREAVLKVAGLHSIFHLFVTVIVSQVDFFSPSWIFFSDMVRVLGCDTSALSLHRTCASEQISLLYSGYHFFKHLNCRWTASQCAQTFSCGACPGTAEHKISLTFSYLYKFYLGDPPSPLALISDGVWPP